MRDDRERLLDILEAIVSIERHTSLGREAFDRDELVQAWTLHQLQTIGEAARRLSEHIRHNHPEVPILRDPELDRSDRISELTAGWRR